MQSQETIYDAVIIGAGPAGVSCAVWLARLGFSAAVLERSSRVGGLCWVNPFHDDWNASLPGVSGAQVAANLAVSLRHADVPVWLSCDVTSIDLSDGPASQAASDRGGPQPGFEVRASDPRQPWKARHVVLATGVRAKGLPGAAPGNAAELAAQGVLIGPGPHIVDQDFRHKRIAVLGGGDNAFENALYAVDRGAHTVHVYARSVRAQRQFARRLPAGSLFVGPCEVDAASRSVNGQPYDLILVFYGWEPCADYAERLALRRSAQGFIDTEVSTAQTSRPGVYAIGEVAQRLHPCVVTAMADGVTAAKAIQARIERG